MPSTGKRDLAGRRILAAKNICSDLPIAVRTAHSFAEMKVSRLDLFAYWKSVIEKRDAAAKPAAKARAKRKSTKDVVVPVNVVVRDAPKPVANNSKSCRRPDRLFGRLSVAVQRMPI